MKIKLVIISGVMLASQLSLAMGKGLPSDPNEESTLPSRNAPVSGWVSPVEFCRNDKTGVSGRGSCPLDSSSVRTSDIVQGWGDNCIEHGATICYDRKGKVISAKTYEINLGCYQRELCR